MKLSRLYSNRPDVFGPIEFNTGLNVVFAEIRLPENRTKDTHNLGKTTLGRMIDFCLLVKRDPNFFLFKYDQFRGFVFFLELELLDNSFVTIRRSVESPSKIFLKRHAQSGQDFSDQPADSWDHAVDFERAKELLDGMLDLRDIKPWKYRNLLGYLIRSQNDFQDVFQLGRFAGPHATWKPLLAQLLGFNAADISALYEKEDELEKLETEEGVLQKELGGTVGDLNKIEGILLLKQDDATKKQRLLDAFDFHLDDHNATKLVVEELDARIAELNLERYAIMQNRRKVLSAVQDDEIVFDPKKASTLFEEAGILFSGQLKKDFEQLISFNRAISEERSRYLKEELTEIDAELQRVTDALSDLNKRRNEALAFLGGSDVVIKYKRVTDELVTLRADIMAVDRQRGFLRRLQELRAAIRAGKEELGHLQTRIETDVETKSTDHGSQFSRIRVLFNEIVEAVIDRKALLSVTPNKNGHLEFKAEVLDEQGNATSADRGNTYRKLLCVAFDMALLRAHQGGHYPRFVFHDGVFDALDDRKKENLLSVIREYAKDDLQHVITVIDSDLPVRPASSGSVFDDHEMTVRLHDEDQSGRLFRMPSW